MLTTSKPDLNRILSKIQYDYPIELTNISEIEEGKRILTFKVYDNELSARYYESYQCLWVNNNDFHLLHANDYELDNHHAYTKLKQFLTESLLTTVERQHGFKVLGFKFQDSYPGKKVLLCYYFNPNPEFTLNLKLVPHYLEVKNFYMCNEVFALKELFKATLDASTTLNRDSDSHESGMYDNLEYGQILRVLNPGGIANVKYMTFDKGQNPEDSPESIISKVILEMMDKITKIIIRQHQGL